MAKQSAAVTPGLCDLHMPVWFSVERKWTVAADRKTFLAKVKLGQWQMQSICE